MVLPSGKYSGGQVSGHRHVILVLSFPALKFTVGLKMLGCCHSRVVVVVVVAFLKWHPTLVVVVWSTKQRVSLAFCSAHASDAYCMSGFAIFSHSLTCPLLKEQCKFFRACVV